MANARLNKKELTLALAEDALKDVIYPDQVREITPALIIDVVAEHFNVPKEEITSKKRNSEYVLPRQIIMYLCRNMIDSLSRALPIFSARRIILPLSMESRRLMRSLQQMKTCVIK